jgi:AraC-like DNA-binding protein
MQVHGPGVEHGWRSKQGGLVRIGLWFAVQPRVPVVRPDVWPRHPAMVEAVQALVAETASPAAGRGDRLKARLTLLLAPALELLDLPGQDPLPEPRRPAPMRKTSDYVERFLADNLREPLKLEDVAAQLCISVPTLTRRFRQETGFSVMERLQELRLRRATELLREKRLSVKQVAAAVGIPEPSYFCRCFRRAFGCAPLQYNAQWLRPADRRPT